MNSYNPNIHILQKICDAQADTIKIQEQVIQNQNDEIDNLKQLVQNQERMIEILLFENRELGGEISKDID